MKPIYFGRGSLSLASGGVSFPRRVPRLLLESAVGVERAVAVGIALVVADVAVDRRLVAGADQAHVAQPVGERAAQGLGPAASPCTTTEKARPARWRG